MPRVTHTPVSPKGSNADEGVKLTMVAATPADDEEVALTGKELIVAQNTGGDPHTVTITSVADPLGRTNDITAASIPAGEIWLFGPFSVTGWRQTNGKLYFEADTADVLFGVIRLP